MRFAVDENGNIVRKPSAAGPGASSPSPTPQPVASTSAPPSSSRPARQVSVRRLHSERHGWFWAVLLLTVLLLNGYVVTRYPDARQFVERTWVRALTFGRSLVDDVRRINGSSQASSDAEATAAPVPMESTATATPATTATSMVDWKAYRTIANVAMFRSEPAKASKALDRFSRGEPLTWLLERETGADGLVWMKMMTTDGMIGWIWEDLVERVPEDGTAQ